MSASADGSISQFFGQLRAGEEAAADRLWQRFCPRLLALARRTLAGRPQRVADADDAVQSAFASFCLRVRGGEFDRALDRNDLWNLLGLFTVRKSHKQVRRERAAKRGGGHVVGESELTVDLDLASPFEAIAGPLAAAEFDLHSEELLLSLDEELRPFAVYRLLGHTNREIADAEHCTERKVERKLHLIRLRWQQAAAD